MTSDGKRCVEDKPHHRSFSKRTAFIEDVDVEAIWDQMFRTSLALFIVFWIAIYFSYGRDLTFDATATCRSRVCRSALTYSEELRSSNVSLACQDFYEYVCGLWNVKKPSVSDVFAVLENAADSQMVGAWNRTYAEQTNQSIFDKTALYFESCIRALSGGVPLEQNLVSYLAVRGIKMRTSVALGQLLFHATTAYSPGNRSVFSWGPSIERGLCKNCRSFLEKALRVAIGESVTPASMASIVDLDVHIYRDRMNDASRATDFTREDLISFVNGSEPRLQRALEDFPPALTVLGAPFFKYALNLLFSQEYVNVSYHYLYLKLLREPLRNHYFVVSQPIKDKQRSASYLCREKLESKLLPVWNVLSYQTISAQSNPDVLEATFETVKASLMDRFRTSSWLAPDVKDDLVGNLLQINTASPNKLDYVDYLKYRYRDAPNLSPDFYKNDWLLRHFTDSCSFQTDILCGPFQDRHHIGLINGTMHLTAVNRLPPMYYSEADAYINAATLYYHIAYHTIVDLLEDVELSNVPQARCLLDQDTSADLPLGTILALTTGLRLAYDIGKPKVRTAEDRVHTVTEDQLFFLRAGLLFCTTGDGGVNRARCNTAVRNIPEFYLAFWCPSDASMPQKGVCEII